MTFPFPVCAPGGTWRTSGSVSLGENNTGWSGFTMVSRWEPGALSTSGSRVRLRFVPPTSGNNTVIANCYIGHAAAAGDAYDFDGTQVRQTFSGNNGITLTAGGSSVLGDEIAYDLDESKAFLIVIDFTTTTDIRRGSSLGSNFNGYTKNATGETATTDKTGYSSFSGLAFVVDQIEVFA